MNLKKFILILNILFIFIFLPSFISNYRLDDLGAACFFIVYPLLNIGIVLFKKDWKILQFLLVVFNLGIFVYAIFSSFTSILIYSGLFGGTAILIIFSVLFILFFAFLNLIYSINIFNKTSNLLQNKIILKIDNKINSISKNNLGRWSIKIGAILFITTLMLIFLKTIIHGASIFYLKMLEYLVAFLYYLFFPLSFLLGILNVIRSKEWRPLFLLVALYIVIFLIAIFSGYIVWG